MNEIGIFTLFGPTSGGPTKAEIRLPSPHLKHLKTRLLLGIKKHEYTLPHAWIDEVNRTYPFITATVIVASIKMESIIPGFRVVTFTTE